MSDFDEMMRAGLISPGSQPFVESKRPPTAEKGPPAATVTVQSNTPTSGTVTVEEVVVSTWNRQRPRALVMCPELADAKAVMAALPYDVDGWVANSVRAAEQERPRMQLLIVDAGFHELPQLLNLGLPCVVLARPDAEDRARAVIGARDMPLVLKPWTRDVLVKAVEEVVRATGSPAAVERRVSQVAAERVRDFDEMMRAGVISPGSQPFVESKRAPAVERGEPTASIHVLSETRSSAPLEVKSGVSDTPRSVSSWSPRPFVVILGGARLDLARQVKEALSLSYQCQVTRPITDFKQRYPRAVLVLVTADAPALLDALQLGLPVVVLAQPDEASRVEALVGGNDRAVVEVLPIDATRLLAVMATLLPSKP